MKVLVTGGAGFIGSHLIEQLLSRGCRIQVLDNFSNSFPERLASTSSSINIIRGNVCDSATLIAASQGADTIFHLAAIVSVARSVEQPFETFEVNLSGTLKVLEAARVAKVRRVILASTCAVYGGTTRLPLTESDPLTPLSPYATSKLAAEEALKLYTRLYGIETVSLRFFNVYGPRQDPTSPYSAVVPNFIKALRAGLQPTIYGDGLQTRDFIYVGDIVESLWAAATLPANIGSVYNVGRGKETSVLDLAMKIGKLLGVTVEPIFAPARSSEVRRSCAEVSAYAVMGFRATTSLDEGLALTIGSR